MRLSIALLVVVLPSAIALAEKPVVEAEFMQNRVVCDLPYVMHNWDFAEGYQDFTTTICEDEGVAAWEFGTDPLFPGFTVWGTRLGVDYNNNAGESLQSPAFEVTESSYLVEVHHWYSMEGWYDGGNLTVNGEVVLPLGDYPAEELSPNPFNDPFCVNGEPGFTSVSAWRDDCFDLSAYLGQTIQLSFDFGSDDSVTDDGWYIASVRVGGNPPVAAESAAWGAIKALYR